MKYTPESRCMHKNFINTFKSIVDIPAGEEEKILGIVSPRTISKGEYFISAGEIPRKFAFSVSGLFRYFYTDEKGNEFTKGFFPENSFISAYSAMIQKRGSHFTIEALEDATLLVIRYDQWQALLQGHVCWKAVLIAMLEKAFCKKESRERELLLYDAATRYQLFLESYPGLDHRIKQHYIASYLGITPVALSRVRKKMGFVNIG